MLHIIGMIWPKTFFPGKLREGMGRRQKNAALSHRRMCSPEKLLVSLSFPFWVPRKLCWYLNQGKICLGLCSETAFLLLIFWAPAAQSLDAKSKSAQVDRHTGSSLPHPHPQRGQGLLWNHSDLSLQLVLIIEKNIHVRCSRPLWRQANMASLQEDSYVMVWAWTSER